jgi:hypothetical protein
MGYLRYATIFTEAASVPQTITTGGVFEKLTAFTTNGASDRVTAVAESDKIIIPDPAIYLVTFQTTFSGANLAIVEFYAYWNGIQQPRMHSTEPLNPTDRRAGCAAKRPLDGGD